MEAGVVVEIASRPTFLVVRLTLEPARCHAPLVPLPGAPPIPRFPWCHPPAFPGAIHPRELRVRSCLSISVEFGLAVNRG